MNQNFILIILISLTDQYDKNVQITANDSFKFPGIYINKKAAMNFTDHCCQYHTLFAKHLFIIHKYIIYIPVHLRMDESSIIQNAFYGSILTFYSVLYLVNIFFLPDLT